MKNHHLIIVTLLLFALACEFTSSTQSTSKPNTPRAKKSPTPTEGSFFMSVQMGGGDDTPVAPQPATDTTRPPFPNQYCWYNGKTIQGPAQPPVPFLYLPFNGTLSSDSWSSQMDHQRPNYQQDGLLAALGEQLRPDRNEPGLAGGTEAVSKSGKTWFSFEVPYTDVLKKGYYLLAYQSPSFESYLYYDGHDGHDFAVWGQALAAGDGTVVFKGNYGDKLGRVVEVYHPQGYLTRYAHLASFANNLEVGKEIKAGQAVGMIGGSAVVNGTMDDGYWKPHLHFSVFRWNDDRQAWQITDPFGWDPWAGPDEQSRQQKQREDPLVSCNGEVSYTLWVDEWPHPMRETTASTAVTPTEDRYVGGWLGEE